VPPASEFYYALGSPALILSSACFDAERGRLLAGRKLEERRQHLGHERLRRDENFPHGMTTPDEDMGDDITIWSTPIGGASDYPKNS
jgi:hypothetical protein